MKLSIAAAIVTMSTTVNARLHPDDDSKKNRKLQWGPKNMVERSLVSPAITAIQGDIVLLKAEDDILHDQIATADTAIDTANTEITELQDDVISLEAADVTLNDQIATADNAISTANANITALAYRLEEAEATISAAVATISAANATISTLTDRLQVLEATKRIVFVTSERYSGGQIDGIAGAHSKCQDLADAAGLSGTFKPWLSSRTFSPAQDFDKSGGPFVMRNDVIVADNWQDLTDSVLDNTIAFDENGDSLISTNVVWTGTDRLGMPFSNGGTFCNDWTSTSGDAFVGRASSTNQFWTSYGYGRCGSEFRLYCFEQ